ncbi:50S ribosomal protein L23 [Candidatus Dojkabacteria bacterium]|nr:50S ribosomal protein L23 [Candidatus Dojkabacteria bacterium]
MKGTNVIIQPVVSEKSFARADTGTYMFRVSRDANKVDVKREVEKHFKVKVEKVNTINRKGKVRMDWRRGRNLSRRQDYKIAIVTLKSGDTIDLFNT